MPFDGYVKTSTYIASSFFHYDPFVKSKFINADLLDAGRIGYSIKAGYVSHKLIMGTGKHTCRATLSSDILTFFLLGVVVALEMKQKKEKENRIS